MPGLAITEFTDPGCPFAFSAEPIRRRLEWLYGDQLDWSLRLIVLSETQDEADHITTAQQARNLRRLQEEHGMPIDFSERPRMAITEPACRRIVAARVHAGQAAERRLLRRFRVLGMAGALIDEREVIAQATREAGLEPRELEAQAAAPETHAALAADKAAAREPSREAQALGHKLGCSGDVERYTCPSYHLCDDSGRRFAVPGFQPLAAYEVAIANLAPELERRDDPESVADVLAWAAEPLATAEVAAVRGLDAAEAHSELAGVAEFEPVGADGYWS